MAGPIASFASGKSSRTASAITWENEWRTLNKWSCRTSCMLCLRKNEAPHGCLVHSLAWTSVRVAKDEKPQGALRGSTLIPGAVITLQNCAMEARASLRPFTGSSGGSYSSPATRVFGNAAREGFSAADGQAPFSHRAPSLPTGASAYSSPSKPFRYYREKASPRQVSGQGGDREVRAQEAGGKRGVAHRPPMLPN